LTVNTTILTFISPPPAVVTEIPIGTNPPVTVEYISGATPQTGVAVNFFTTRGALSSTTAVTGADGRATVTVSSTSSGPALLVASIAGGPSSQVAVEFVATTVSFLDLKASPATIGTNSGGSTTEKSLITATVRDVNDNLVKNRTVSFTIVNDASAGSLSPASAITDSFGTAGTYFIAGASTGGLGGVTIRAAVIGTAVSATTRLTVAKKALFIALATGPTIVTVDPNKYRKDYVALVTDAAGNPVVGATVVAVVTPVYYKTGYYQRSLDSKGTFVRWQQVPTLEALSSTLPGIPACANEDGMLHNSLYDFNGILDPGEDQNGNNRLDPGNVASVTAATTDSTGHGTVSIVYARDYAYWVNVKLEAFANDLKGSTASADVTFDLPGLAIDYTKEEVSPPGDPSPFGTSTSCYATVILPPSSPTGLTATAISPSQIRISWTAVAGVTGYHIYRDSAPLKSVVSTSTTDTGLTANTLYCYAVSGYNAAGVESVKSGQVCATTQLTAPPTPTGLRATGSAGPPPKVTLAWNASAGANKYNIYRDGGVTPVLSVSAPAVTAEDTTDLLAKTGYCYTVSAEDVAGNESDQSTQVCTATGTAAPPMPTGLTAVAVGSSAIPLVPYKVTLTWTTSAGAATYYIYRDGTFLKSATGAQATDFAVLPATNYCYAISAVDALGNESARSDPPVCTTTPP
jgi:fibronectin type 3 domain-containing protein